MRFEFVGKISKVSEKLGFYTETVSAGGWKSRTLKFNVAANGSQFLCELRDGMSNDENKATVYSFVRDAEGKNQQVKFLYKDRNKYIDQIAEFKKSVLVLDKDTRLEFATQYDLAEALKDIIESEQYKDSLFRVVGEVEYSKWNDKKTNEVKYGKKFVPQRVYVTIEEEERAEGVAEVLLMEGAFDDTDYDETKKVLINTNVQVYNKNTPSKQELHPQVIEYDFSTMGDNADKAYNRLKEMLDVSGEELHKFGFKVEYINGSQKVEFTLEQATEEEREMVDLGFMTEEDLRRQYSHGRTPKVSKIMGTGVSKGYASGAITTGLTLESYQEKVASEDEIDDLFN